MIFNRQDWKTIFLGLGLFFINAGGEDAFRLGYYNQTWICKSIEWSSCTSLWLMTILGITSLYIFIRMALEDKLESEKK